MQNGASSPRNDLSDGALNALLKGLSKADALAVQAEIERRIQWALVDAEARHQREILAVQDAYLTAEAAHQKDMREAHEAYQQHIQSIYEHIRLSRQRLFGRSSEAHVGQQSLQFDEVEQTAEGSTDEHDQALIPAADAHASEDEAAHPKTRRSAPRARGKREPIPSHITRVKVVIDVPES
jgi:hypothetical protein